MEKKYDLEDRLVKFAGDVIIFLNDLPNDRAGNTLSGQLIIAIVATIIKNKRNLL